MLAVVWPGSGWVEHHAASAARCFLNQNLMASADFKPTSDQTMCWSTGAARRAAEGGLTVLNQEFDCHDDNAEGAKDH
jgi:hypothetical protein